MSARSVSAWDCTDTYSPAAIDIAPAARPATPAVSTAAGVAPVAATPTIRLAVEITPSLAPSTAARNHPIREALCHSAWRCGMRTGLSGMGAGDADNTVSAAKARLALPVARGRSALVMTRAYRRATGPYSVF